MSAFLPEFRASRCARYRFRYSECRRCADACPHDAVTLTDEGVSLDGARCRNCALCASACRTEALVPGNLPRIELLKQASRQQGFSFACAPSQAPGDAIVPCLGALGVAAFAYLAKRGIPVELRGTGHCTECPHGAKGAAQLELNLDALERLRDAAKPHEWAAITLDGTAREGTETARHRHSRRQLFRRLIGRGVDEVERSVAPQAQHPVPQNAIRAGRPFVAAERELLQWVLKTGEAQRAIALRPHAALPLMQLRLKSGCNACEACFRACPTGALQVRESSTEWALAFEHDRCVACGVCTEVCRPKALYEREEMNAAPGRAPSVLLALRKQRCERCDRFFVSTRAQEACPVCIDDDGAFSAIFG
ncbi:MAG: 4Fe-4S dicluster domain-containing protein [Burkholderiales bacterium]